MIRTDLWDRAVPWTKLLKSPLGQAAGEVLNVSASGKLSVLGALTFWFGVLLAIFSLATGVLVSGLGLIVIAAANLRFLALVRNLDGTVQLSWAMLMLLVHFTCAGVGFALVRLNLDPAA